MTHPRWLLVAAMLIGCTDSEFGPTQSQRWFADEALQRGLEFRHVSGATGDFLLPEIMGGGAALADIDGDGDLDAYFVQSGDSAALQPNADPSAPGAPFDVSPASSQEAALANRLFLNRGDGYFDEAPISEANNTGYGMSVTAGDYDNDGDVDLYVTNVGQNVLLCNSGSGQFENVTAVAGVGDPGFSTAATFFDADQDDDLDLFVVNMWFGAWP